MKLLLVGGFLGAGKTTLISKLLPSMEAMGMRLALIENEFGEQSIDSVTLSGHQVSITGISGGCVCCQLVGNLISALAEIEEEIDPHWCIIELSGMAVTANTLTALRQYYRPDLEVLSIVAVDAQRWKKLQRIAGPRVQAQLTGADAVFLSKLDLCTELPKVDCTIPKLQCIEEVLDLISAFRGGEKAYSLSAAEEPWVEAMHRHVDFHETADKQTVVEKLKTLILEAGQGVVIDGIIPGHIKGIARMDGGSITASMTVMGKVNISDLCETGKTDGYAIDIYTFL